MTVNEVIDIIKGSALWKTLSKKERLEAVTYTLEVVGLKAEEADITDVIGEVYQAED